jgi:hypothetical protein
MKKVVIDAMESQKHEFQVRITESLETINRLLDQYRETGLKPIETADQLAELWADPQKFICQAANPDLCKVLKISEMFKMLSLPGLDQITETIRIYPKIVEILGYIQIVKGQAVGDDARIQKKKESMIRYAETEAELELFEATQAAKAAIQTLKKYITNKDELLRALGLMPPYRSY